MEGNGDMTEARSFMQRGLRFNKASKQLWLEYTKLELVYIAKIITRRRLLGIDGQNGPTVPVENKDEDGEMIELPIVTAEDLDPELKQDGDAGYSPLSDLENNLALNGAIPLAVFDAAVKEIPEDIEFVFSFFNLFAGFPGLHCLPKLLQHVVGHALISYPTSPLALFMDIRAPIIGLEPSNPSFPSTLSSIFEKVVTNIDKAAPRSKLFQHVTSLFLELLGVEDLDPAMVTVLKGVVIKYFKQAEAGGDIVPEMYLSWANVLESSGKKGAAQAVLKRAGEACPM